MTKYPLYVFGTKFTETQYALVKAYGEERGLSRPADILRSLVRDAFAAQGVEFPFDPPAPGGVRANAGRKKQSSEDA